MHFCTYKQANGHYESTWYRMPFKPDIVRMLKTYGRLPFSTIEESLRVAQENEKLRQELAMLKKPKPKQI